MGNGKEKLWIGCKKKQYSVCSDGKPVFQGSYKETRKYLKTRSGEVVLKFHPGIDNGTKRTLEGFVL